jgi:DHA2 family methylenomycin A resistance protein-like MFS transporter
MAERRAEAPMLPGGLVRAPAFLGTNGIALIMNLVTNGTLFVVTLQLQQVQGHPALLAGAMLLPLALPLVLLAPVSGALTARHGSRFPVRTGVVIAGAGSLGLLLVGPDAPFAAMLPALVGIGVGDGLITAAVVSGAMRAAPPAYAGLAGGFNNTARQVGTALGVAVYGAVAGPAAHVARFTAGVHALAWTSLALWLGALVLTRAVPSQTQTR